MKKMRFSVYHLHVPRITSSQDDPIVDAIRGFSGHRPTAVSQAWDRTANDVAKYRRVAEVDVVDLEDAFRCTNHIDHNWTENPEVIAVHVATPRSTSVGDVLVNDETGSKVYVDLVGFKEF